MQTSSIKLAWKVIFVQGIYIAILGLLWIFLTKTMNALEFNSFTGESWSEFLTTNTKSAELLIVKTKAGGAWTLVIGLLIALMAWKSYSKAEKWCWYIFLVTGIIGWGSVLAYYIVIGNIMSLIIAVGGTILFVIGIALPAKAILCKKASGK